MATNKPGKVKSKPMAAPQTRAQAEQYMAEISDLARQIAEVERGVEGQIKFHAKTIDLLRLDARRKVSEFEQTQQELVRGLQVWSEAHRAELLAGQGKSFSLVSGVCSWAWTPWRVILKAGSSLAEAIAELKRRRANKYLRIKTELDKEAILADREAFVKRNFNELGVTHHEEFVIKPNDIPVELRAHKGAKLKRVAVKKDDQLDS